MVNADILKSTVEEDLREIKKCKIHILMLEEKNNELCEANNKEIARLAEVIENRELCLKENLDNSGERKIDTLAGWCAYRAMPDKWNYDEPILIEWAKEDEGRKAVFVKVKVVEELNKEQLKDEVKAGLLKVESVSGLTITPQEPKFNYKLNGGL